MTAQEQWIGEDMFSVPLEQRNIYDTQWCGRGTIDYPASNESKTREMDESAAERNAVFEVKLGRLR